MMMLTRHTTLLLILIASGCDNAKRQSDLTNQAIVIHNSMIKKADGIERALQELSNDSTFIHQQDSIHVAKNMLASWKLELVEVPGNESHQHDNHHHAQQSIDVTDEQMLAIQEELSYKLSSIEKLIMRIKSAKQE